jgi:serine protease Do
VEVTLWDGREFTAEVTARDARRDLAALRIPVSNLHAAVLADSSRTRPGEVAIAVGNPLGFLGAMTMGIVHSFGPLRGLGERSWVQADVRLAPGNSGGPLADVNGRVMGITTMMAGKLSLAIPSNEVVQFLLGETGGHCLGVTVTQVGLPAASKVRTGLLVLGIEPGSPAALASLLPGDILLGTEEAAFPSAQGLAELLAQGSGGSLRLIFLRGNSKRIRTVTVLLSKPGRRPIAA